MTELRVLVTGGSRGIGRAIALRFAREGAKVAVAARNSALLDSVVAEIEAAGGQGRAQQMDVSDHGSVEAAVWRAVEFTGGALDVLVNNAGVFASKPFADLDLSTWERHIAVNLNGPFYVTTEAYEALLESGRAHVFNISSVAGRKGFAGSTAYCATKYGLRGFSDALRLDLAGKGVRVTTIYPGSTDTDMLKAVPAGERSPRPNRPEDVAEVIWNTWKAAPGTEVSDVDVPPPA